eukprot:scaffold22842_cov65-Phaeocystis_antarctica.AAC.2
MKGECSQWALTRKQTFGAAAHLRWVIFVFLRTAASAEAPLTPMSLYSRLQGVGGSRRVSTGADTKANTSGAAAHSRLVICVSLRTAASAEVPSTPMLLYPRLHGIGGSRWALTRKRTLGSWFERRAAYSSDCSVVLPLRASARAAPPLGPRPFHERLRAWERGRC